MGMLSGEKQWAEIKRQANLGARALSQDEKEAIQKRREACRERRRDALKKAEAKAGPGSGLQARIALRRKAMEEAETIARRKSSGREEQRPAAVATGSDVAEMNVDSAGSHPGELKAAGVSQTQRRLTPAPKRQRTKRLTFTAVTSALQEVSSSDAAARIEAAKALAAQIFNTATPASAEGQVRGAKRSFGGARRSSVGSWVSGHRDSIGSNVGAEAMLKRAAKLTVGSGNDAQSSDEETARPKSSQRFSEAGCQVGGGVYKEMPDESSENIEPCSETSMLADGDNPSKLRKRRLALVGSPPPASAASPEGFEMPNITFGAGGGSEALPPPPARLPRRRIFKLHPARRPLTPVQQNEDTSFSFAVSSPDVAEI